MLCGRRMLLAQIRYNSGLFVGVVCSTDERHIDCHIDVRALTKVRVTSMSTKSEKSSRRRGMDGEKGTDDTRNSKRTDLK
jgi:hypothetical protein